MPIPAKLQLLIDRHSELAAKLMHVIEPNELAEISKEYHKLDPIAAQVRELSDLDREIIETQDLVDEGEDDPEMLREARSELRTLKLQYDELNEKLKLDLLPSDKDDDSDIIIEIRAGTGGDEAGLFAADLMRMYERYAAGRDWKVEVHGLREATQGGIKEMTGSITGTGVYSRLKWESGVHRVQRVPATEASGRIHTSAATVAILPEVKDIDFEIEEKDLRIDIFRASGAGGQHVNKTDSAIRITHIPSNMVVVQQSERSQHRNRAAAMRILRARLYEFEREKNMRERSEMRRTQVGTGDRSERIRTYNFPQGRVTDHRIGLTLYKLTEMLEGEILDDIIDALAAEHRTKMLAEVDGVPE